MQDFDYQLRPRICFGPNTIQQLGGLVRELGCKRVLVVSDQGLVNAGIYQAGYASLIASQIDVLGFHDLAENPTTKHVELGLRVARSFQPDMLVGLGGGSSMDCAKGINFLYSGGGRMQDYWGIGKATSAMLPMIAVPTTSGTGSETQSFALISDAETHVKMACGDPKAACKVALLDPNLTLSQPASVTALTGIDALTHALETFVCNRRTPMSECFSREAWLLLSRGFPSVLASPSDIEARGQMQLGACFAGMAIEASMLGAAHALANPLTAKFGMAHGQAVGLMMPHVIRFNQSVVADRYAELASMLGSPTNGMQGAEYLASTFSQWLERAGLSTRLRDHLKWPEAERTRTDGTETLLLELAGMASNQWTATFNPRPVATSDLLTLYRSAF
jgi:alcohol dehydrogenase